MRKSKNVYSTAFEIRGFLLHYYGIDTPLTPEAILCRGVQLPMMFKTKDGRIIIVDFYKSRLKQIIKHLYALIKVGVPVKGKLKYVKMTITEV